MHAEAQLKAALIGVGSKYVGQGWTLLDRVLPNRLARISVAMLLFVVAIGSAVVLVANRGASNQLEDERRASDNLNQQINDQTSQQVAALRAKAAQLRTQDAGSDDQPVHHKTVDDLISEDPFISNLIDMDDQFGQIRSGIYPRDIIDLWIIEGKMTAKQAIHVQNFCQMIQNHQY